MGAPHQSSLTPTHPSFVYPPHLTLFAVSPSPVLCCLPTPTSATVAAAAAPQVPLPQVTPFGDRVFVQEVWAATHFSTAATIFHTHLLLSRRKCSKPLFFSPPFLSPHLFCTHFLSLSFALNSNPHDLCLHVHLSNLSSVFTTPLIHFPSAFQMHSLHMPISMQTRPISPMYTTLTIMLYISIPTGPLPSYPAFPSFPLIHIIIHAFRSCLLSLFH